MSNPLPGKEIKNGRETKDVRSSRPVLASFAIRGFRTFGSRINLEN